MQKDYSLFNNSREVSCQYLFDNTVPVLQIHTTRMEVISIPFVPTLANVCTKLRIEPPKYSFMLQRHMFTYTVDVQLGNLPDGTNNIVKVNGSISRKLEFAKESAVRAAILTLKAFYNFDVDDINLDDAVDMKDNLKKANWEIDGLKYELQVQQYTNHCTKAYWLDQVRILEVEVAALKAQLDAMNPGEGSTPVSVETDPEEDYKVDA